MSWSLTSNQVESDNDDDFGTVPSISEALATMRALKKFLYTKFEGTNDERKALFLL